MQLAQPAHGLAPALRPLGLTPEPIEAGRILIVEFEPARLEAGVEAPQAFVVLDLEIDKPTPIELDESARWSDRSAGTAVRPERRERGVNRLSLLVDPRC